MSDSYDEQLDEDRSDEDSDEDRAAEDWADEDEEPAAVSRQALPTARAAAIVGLLGVGSLPGMLFLGLGAPMAVVALVMAPSARRQVLDSHGRFGGLGLIRAARICSVISLVIAVVMAVGLVLAYHWLIDYAREHNSSN